MYRGFRLKNFALSIKEEKEYYEEGLRVYEQNKNNIKIELEKHFTKEKYLDASSLQNLIFPKELEFDIFLSHSHADIKEVTTLAGYLMKKYKLKVFIDSYIWGNVTELLKEIDDKYCKIEEKKLSYIYDKRNISTSHCHIMLSASLIEMIDRIECFIFLDTEKTVSLEDEIEKTYSCWIYHELETSKIIRRNIPKRRIGVSESIEFSTDNQLRVSYPITTEHLTEINFKDLKELESGIINLSTSIDILEGSEKILDEIYKKFKVKL